MPSTATATCSRCNGTGQYHGTRRDGSSYLGVCFSCQPAAARPYWRGRARPAVVPVTADIRRESITPGQPVPALGPSRGANALVAFAAVHPAEYDWLVAQNTAGVTFAASLLGGLQRYGNLTPRQLAAVQRNLGHVEPVADSLATTRAIIDAGTIAVERAVAAESAPVVSADPHETPVVTARAADGSVANVTYGHAPVTIDMSQIFAAFDTAAASGLRKVRLTLGNVELKRTGERFRGGAGNVMVYIQDAYKGCVSRDNVFHLGAGRTLTSGEESDIRSAVANPRAAAATHGHDTGHCSCCRRLLTDPPSVMAGIGPVCITRFGWSF